MLAIFIPTVQSEIEAGNLIGTALVTATGHVPYRTITQQVIGYKVTKNIVIKLIGIIIFNGNDNLL